MSKLFKELRNYENISENLPKYALNTAVYTKLYSTARFGLNLINISDYSDEKTISKEALSLLDELKNIWNEYINDSDGSIGKYIEKIDGLRYKNRDMVSDNTNYTIVFATYQHVLNRVEGKFKDNFDLNNNSVEECVNDIVKAIMSAGKDGLSNSLIRRVVGELPVRLTKEKFAEYLRAGLSLYSDVNKNILDDFTSMIRYNSLLNDFKGTNEKYDSFVAKLNEVDFKNINEEQYDALNNRINEVSDEIDDMVTFHVILQQLINDLYLILICDEIGTEELINKFGDEFEVQLNKLRELFVKINDYDAFVNASVGVQEEYYEKVDKLFSLNTEGFILNCYDKEEIDKTLGVVSDKDEFTKLLNKCSKLLSTSDFIELSEKQAEKISIDYFEKECDRLIDDVTNSLKSKNRYVKRAIMSGVLSSLPVFFQNLDEFTEYIRLSLESCSDDAEKAGSLALIYEIISEY